MSITHALCDGGLACFYLLFPEMLMYEFPAWRVSNRARRRIDLEGAYIGRDDGWDLAGLNERARDLPSQVEYLPE